MERFDILYIILVISILVVLYFVLLIAKKRKKKQIHYAVLGIAISILIWNIAVLLYLTFNEVQWLLVICEKMYFLGAIFVSVAILFTGLIFAQTRIKFTWKHVLLFIVPMISVVMLFTNHYHHLFYSKFSLTPSKQIYGIYYTIHTIYSYLCIGIGLTYLGYFSIKNYGFFSKQSLLIFFSILISLIFDSFSTFRIFDWPTTIENIVFAVSIICFILAIIKFDFLNVIPIALQTVVDLISDGYIVINEEYEIIDYNKAFVDNCAKVNRKDNIVELINRNHFDIDDKTFIGFVEEAVSEQKKVSFEMQRLVGEVSRYYMTEITPIFIGGNHTGTIILIKDITEHKNDLAQVRQLNERLQSLATQDWLTQVYNRYFFDERLQQEIDRLNKLQAYRQGAYKTIYNFGLIMFDIDFFKIYNDNNGHLAGDELLQKIAMVVKEVLYPTDILCRYGGEEFAVICCQTSAAGINTVAEKIRKTVEHHEFKFQDKQPNGNLTVSVGAVYCSTGNLKKDDLIKKADNNLYLAKSSGKNKVVISYI
ncbi:MAG: diguanylate cyclase [Bacillota bacterium]|jgi:diguanylate cyclase (GGDEF)-like protein